MRVQVAVVLGPVCEQVTNRVETVEIGTTFRAGGNVLVETAELLGLDGAAEEPVPSLVPIRPEVMVRIQLVQFLEQLNRIDDTAGVFLDHFFVLGVHAKRPGSVRSLPLGECIGDRLGRLKESFLAGRLIELQVGQG